MICTESILNRVISIRNGFGLRCVVRGRDGRGILLGFSLLGNSLGVEVTADSSGGTTESRTAQLPSDDNREDLSSGRAARSMGTKTSGRGRGGPK